MPIKSVEVRVNSRTRKVEVGGGIPGPIGISIVSGTINGSGHLILTLSNGSTIDTGYVVGPPGPIASITETGNGINIDLSSPTNPVLSLDATLEAIANFATGANRVMVWSGTDTLTTFTVDIDGTLAANSDTRFATQKAVKTYVDGLIAAQDAMVFKGVIDASTNPNYPAADRGHTYRISVAGKIGGASGVNVEAGDLIICLTDGTAAGTQAAVGANWTISQTNLDGAVIGPASATDAAVAGFSGTTGKLIKVLTAAEIRTAAVLATSDTPQFAGLQIGHATDTTLTRASAGVLAVEGVAILNASGQQTVNDKDLVDSTTDIIGNADATKRSGFANDLITAGQRSVMTIPDRSGVILTDPLAATDVLPTLDLRFSNIDGAPFDDFFTRFGAGGYRQNAKGILVPTVDREPVIDFSDGQPLGAGFYGAYTNLALWSEEFDNAAWTKSEVTITTNAAVAPDGTTTMDKIVESVNNAVHQAFTIASVTSGQQYTLSIFVSAAERSKIRLDANDGAVGAGNYVDFDLVAKTATPAGNCVGKIEELPSGAFRVSATFTATATTSASFSVILRDTAGSPSYAGNGTSGLYAWGAQLTATAFPVPYVPTTSATVARNADSMVISGTDFTDFFNSAGGTLFCEAEAPRASAIEYPSIVEFGTPTDRISLLLGGDDQTLRLAVRVASTFVVDLRSAVVAAGSTHKIACRLQADNWAVSYNGGVVATDTGGAMPNVAQMLFGTSVGSNVYIKSHIRRVIYWPKALSAAQLERMTA